MDSLLDAALRGAQSPSSAPAAPTARREALVWGAGGTLGSAVLERSLGAGLFARTWAVSRAAVAPAVRGFHTVPAGALAAARGVDTAFIVFERERHSNGRDEAFDRPGPERWAEHAAALQALGVRRLLVLMPHTQALLPQALRAGLATLEEAAVAAMGFEHLVLVRTAAPAHTTQGGSPPQRLALWMLRQLLWMTPQAQQWVRGTQVAAVALEVARQLPLAPPANRVMPPEAVWTAAQAGNPQALVRAWLAGEPWPAVRGAPLRL